MKRSTLTFECLEAWQQARTVAKRLYNLTRSACVKHDYGLKSQVQRAGVSVMTNLAEGYERVHLAEKLQFYNVARGSNAEVRSLLYVLEDNYAGVAPVAAALRTDVDSVGRLVSGLIASTEARKRSA